MSESRESRPSLALRARWAQGFLFLIPAIFCWGLARHEPALLIDDAYITFRYAENLARGLGPVFNPGERVLGTTAPLWAGILAGARLLGFAIPSAALVLGQIFTAVTCGLLAWILFRHVAAPLAVLAGLVLALHPDVIFFANSGMETGLSMALVLGSLGTALRRRFLAAGVLSGAAFLVRPDGALLLLLGGVLALLQGRKSLVRFAIAAAVLVLPWIIFAMIFYGSPIPQSIAAKQLIHATSFRHALMGYALLFLPPVWPMRLLAALALPGLGLALISRGRLWPFAAWAILYIVGLVFSRISAVFPWYLTPLLPVMCLFDSETWNRFFLRGTGIPACHQPAWLKRIGWLGAILLLGLGGWLYSFRPFYLEVREAQFGRVREYERLGEWLKTQARPGDQILVGEVGVLSFALMDFPVLDSSGINSPEILRLHRADQERSLAAGQAAESARWVKEVIQRFQPEWIVTWHRFLHLEELAQDPDLRSRYVRVKPPLPNLDRFFVLERRESP